MLIDGGSGVYTSISKDTYGHLRFSRAGVSRRPVPPSESAHERMYYLIVLLCCHNHRRYTKYMYCHVSIRNNLIGFSIISG